MALVLLPALRRARVRLHAVFDWRHPAVRKMLRLVGLDDRLRRHEPDRVAVRARAGEERHHRQRLRVPLRVHVLPSAARAARGVDHDDDDARAVAQRVAEATSPGLRLPVPRRAALPRSCSWCPRPMLFIVLAQPMLGVLVRGGFRPHDAAVTADTLQALVDRARSVLGVPLHAARLLRAARHVHAVLDQRDRERRSTSCSRSRCSRRSACRGSRWRGAAPTRSPRCSRSSCCAAACPHPVDRAVGWSALRAVVGTVALAIVAAPLAAAIGHLTANRALLATAVAGLGRMRRVPRRARRAAHAGARVARRSAPAASAFLPTS